MAITSLDLWLTELAEAHEAHRVILASLQACTQFTLAGEQQAPLTAAMLAQRDYMALIDGARTALEGLQGTDEPALDDDLSAVLRAQAEAVISGLKPSGPAPQTVAQTEPPKVEHGSATPDTGREVPRRGRPPE